MFGSQYFSQDYFADAPSNPFLSVSDTTVTSENVNLQLVSFISKSDTTTTSETSNFEEVYL